MKIKRVHIENFRCLRAVDITVEEITSFLGPTGAGKSTVLRALDWFFNGEKSVGLNDDDLHSSGDGARITVEVEFDGLTTTDREQLGPRYAPPGTDSLIVWRTWESGEDKITAKGRAFPPFEAVRQEPGAMPQRRAYNALREERSDLCLPPAGSATAVEDAMRTWELAHRDQLTETDIAGTHFFGFAGQGKLAELIDFVFVSADLRAVEETHDSKSTALGRLIDHAVDRTQVAEQISKIEERVAVQREEAHFEAYGETLADLSNDLSREIEKLTSGRTVRVTPVVQPPKHARTAFGVRVQDGSADTAVERQGHGFQRTLILVTLKHLAERRRSADNSRTLCLAIEEPELFQHPAQARTFAEVLRHLVSSSEGHAQVMYATHSAAFIDGANYHEVRRLSRGFLDDHPVTTVHHVSENALHEALIQHGMSTGSIKKSGPRCIPTLGEAFFADVAVLVEGPTDAAVIQACADRQRLGLGAKGIVIVSAAGKNNLMFCHQLLSALGVRCHMVFDGDADKSGDALKETQQLNSNLLAAIGEPRLVSPATDSVPAYTVFATNLDTYLEEYWPAWMQAKENLSNAGLGCGSKDAATYGEAARIATTEPPDVLHALLENVRKLVRC